MESALAKAESTLYDGGDAPSLTLTQAASLQRQDLAKKARDAAATAEMAGEGEELDERLVASQQAIEAFQRAADAAKKNARRLAAILERR